MNNTKPFNHFLLDQDGSCFCLAGMNSSLVKPPPEHPEKKTLCLIQFVGEKFKPCSGLIQHLAELKHFRVSVFLKECAAVKSFTEVHRNYRRI